MTLQPRLIMSGEWQEEKKSLTSDTPKEPHRCSLLWLRITVILTISWTCSLPFAQSPTCAKPPTQLVSSVNGPSTSFTPLWTGCKSTKFSAPNGFQQRKQFAPTSPVTKCSHLSTSCKPMLTTKPTELTLPTIGPYLTPPESNSFTTLKPQPTTPSSSMTTARTLTKSSTASLTLQTLTSLTLTFQWPCSSANTTTSEHPKWESGHSSNSVSSLGTKFS